MKLVIDEKLKHRLVGISVILSLGAIFLPAMLKKSSQRLENSFSVNVKLPPKPIAPDVAVTNEEEMFKTIKIAKVKITSESEKKTLTELDKEDFIASVPVDEDALPIAKVASASVASVKKPLELALNDATKSAVKKEIKVASKPVAVAKVVTVKQATKVKPILAKALTLQKPAVKGIYAVQLASFAKLANAQALVNKLQHSGYKANYARTEGRNGVIYKVYVGHSPIREDVVKLKTQLASAMQLNGFVVNTGVS